MLNRFKPLFRSASASHDADIELSELPRPHGSPLNDAPSKLRKSHKFLGAITFNNLLEKHSFNWQERVAKWSGQRITAWKAGMVLNIFGAFTILLVNIFVTTWAMTKYGTQRGILYQGDCGVVKHATLAGHAIINILGTILLAASNYTMQILVAPTREDANMAHRERRNFKVGVQSIGNLRIISKYRAFLWILLALASVPLHLVYNSVIFSSTGENGYKVAVVKPEFLEGAPFNTTSINNLQKPNLPLSSSGNVIVNDTHNLIWTDYYIPTIAPEDDDLLKSLQSKARAGRLSSLTNEECIMAFNATTQTRYGNVIAVSEGVVSNSSVVWLDHFSPGDESTSWICRYTNKKSSALNTNIPALNIDCTSKILAGNLTVWSIGVYALNLGHNHWRIESYPISSCLVESYSSCVLQYDIRLLITVIVANSVKVIVMVATLMQYKMPALITIGDGIASFLQSPDEVTKGMCLATNAEFRSSLWESKPRRYSKDEKDRYRSGISRGQWVASIALYAITMVSAAVLFARIYDSSEIAKWSFSTSIRPETIRLGRGLDPVTLVIMGNIPQVALSFNYLQLNRLLTRMAVSREWSLYAHQRKGLRTSNPTGAQRSTYWLQLPFKFALPLMASSAALHYLASQSLFFGSVRYYSPYEKDGKRIVSNDITGLGYSQNAVYILMICLLLIKAAVVFWGRSKNNLGMPQLIPTTATISAACHPSEEPDVHLKPVQWGEVVQSGDDNIIRHCSFSSGEVMLPVEGDVYI